MEEATSDFVNWVKSAPVGTRDISDLRSFQMRRPGELISRARDVGCASSPCHGRHAMLAITQPWFFGDDAVWFIAIPTSSRMSVLTPVFYLGCWVVPRHF